MDIQDNINNANNESLDELMARMRASAEHMNELVEERKNEPVNLNRAIREFGQNRNTKKYTAPKGTKNRVKELSRKSKEFIHKNRNRIKVAVLITIIVLGASSAIKQVSESKKETNQIVEEYNSDIEAIKGDIRNKIAGEFEKTLGMENLQVEIKQHRQGSQESGNIIEVVDQEGKVIFSYKDIHDLGGGPDRGNNKSNRLSKLAEDYSAIKDEKDAAKVLNKTNKFTEKYDLEVSIGGKESTVDDIRDDER